ATFGRAAAAFAAAGVLACAANALLYAVPVPYAGYLFGTAAAQTLTAEPSLTFRVWVGLPAILYDRTFGVAGSAPWLFIGALGALLIAALPARALNSAFEGKLQELYDDVLGVNPLGWLPSFQPVTPDWYVAAYLRLVPALLLTAALAWWGWRRRLA